MRKFYFSFLAALFFVFALNQVAAQCVPSAAQTFTNSTPLTIPTGPAVVTSTMVVAGARVFLADVNIVTNITHTFNADLDITITSPAGTVVTLTTDNGGSFDNVFNGTTWDDDANPGGLVPYTNNNGMVTDHLYVNLVLASPLTPEEPLGAFLGENPNGTWTITISDDLGGDGGILSSWSVILTGLPAAPTFTTTTSSNTTPLTIPTGPAVVTSTIAVSGLGTQLMDLNILTNITHTFNADLDITITSPAGTVVTLTTDNAGSFDNVYNGTTWDDDANPGGLVPYTNNNGMVTDHLYVNLVLASPLTPEEALAAFIGENPNGTWTITISDDLGGDGGTLSSWSLILTTGTCVPPCSHTALTSTVTTACSPGTATISGTAINGAPGNYTHALTGPGTITQNPSTGPNNSTGNFTITNLPAGTHSFVLTSTDAIGCVVSSTISGVLIKQTPIITFTPAAPVICFGAIQQITANVVPTIMPTFTQPGTTIVPAGAPGNTSGIASPYPSTLAVSGLPTSGVLVKSVKIGNFHHTFPDDVDIVLVSPTGVPVVLMSDIGGGTDVAGVDYVLDDAAASLLADAALNPSGTYRPTNFGATDVYPAPGPGSLTQATPTLASFGNANYNGTWNLYIVDGFTGDAGFVGNWNITFSIPSTVVFSPVTGLYLDPAATIPYAGTPVTVVYSKPNTTTTYTVNSTVDGCSNTNTITVTVNQLPTITVQPTPATQNVCPGFNVSYSVTATGTGLTYQWQRNGVNLANGGQISGATSTTLTINAVTAANSGSYTVVVSGACPPTATSTPVVLNVATAPVISTQPASQTVCVGVNVSFTVATVGSVPAPTIYQWEVSTDGGATWTNLLTGGSFTPTFTLSNVALTDNAKRFRVRVTNFCGQSTTSSAAILTVNANPVVSAGTLPRICLSDTLISLVGTPVGGSWSGIGVSGFNFVPSATAVGSYTLTYRFTNAANCTATATVIANVESCPERIRLLRDNAVIVYPNPNNGRFNIRMNSTLYNYLAMRVYNSSGQLLTVKIWGGLVYGRVIPVDLSHFPSGTYMVKLYYDDGVRTAEKTYPVIIGRN